MSSDSEHLQSLGSEKTKYPTSPEEAQLETFKNLHPDNIYLVPFVQERDEFTSLCPKTGQPDHAKIEIIYVPNELMVESKSLKLYLFSFRNTGEFHEDVCNRIAKDLFNLMKPKYLRVYGDFAPRGGLAIKPLIEMRQEEKEFENISEVFQIENLVKSWDIKNK